MHETIMDLPTLRSKASNDQRQCTGHRLLRDSSATTHIQSPTDRQAAAYLSLLFAIEQAQVLMEPIRSGNDPSNRLKSLSEPIGTKRKATSAFKRWVSLRRAA
ncbi:uncharacterized protein RCO7_03643 [Rhynchosporium graminicola]|uniref:Uncharacterized protein n=1 Tax=Rhynchosporium graminicola TaxID=2792576 RepID=A0A1E1LIB7_9HELO|nr:uncharacterized protein RCO7_03643 [Rhynchosporium commune]